MESEIPSETKAKIARLLIAKLEIFEDHVQIYFNLDESLADSFEFAEKKGMKNIQIGSQPTNLDRLSGDLASKKKISGVSSFCLTNGANERT